MTNSYDSATHWGCKQKCQFLLTMVLDYPSIIWWDDSLAANLHKQQNHSSWSMRTCERLCSTTQRYVTCLLFIMIISSICSDSDPCKGPKPDPHVLWQCTWVARAVMLGWLCIDILKLFSRMRRVVCWGVGSSGWLCLRGDCKVQWVLCCSGFFWVFRILKNSLSSLGEKSWIGWGGPTPR